MTLAEMIARYEANKKLDATDEEKMQDPRRCCPKAEIVPCVCWVSYKCPVHGQRCYGTHD